MHWNISTEMRWRWMYLEKLRSAKINSCKYIEYWDQQRDLSVQDADYESFTSYACQKS